MRDEPTPAAARIAEKGGDPTKELGYSTWAGWFSARFDEDLGAYAKRAKTERLREKVKQ